MTAISADLHGKTALVTGAARRVGAEIARTLHAAGMNICLHYHLSEAQARRLHGELTARRADSVELLCADLRHERAPLQLAQLAGRRWGRLDALINNASSFYPTPVRSASTLDWQELMSTNLRAPFFLSQSALPFLVESRGCIVNIADIHANRPLRHHSIYCIAKAGLAMLTKALARELGPEVRVNAVAPGAILWPAQGADEYDRERILDRVPLRASGGPADIAEAVLYLVAGARYVTGHTLVVDGGRSVQQ